MICPRCGASIGREHHHSQWDEKSDGSLILHSEWRCPKCQRVTHDYDAEYEWLPGECYPAHP